MDTCPRCVRRVERTHAVPPEVVTKELLEAFDRVDDPTALETCGDCLNDLLSGTTVS